MSEKPTLGELSDKSFVFKDVTWTIPDVSSLSTYVDYGVQSPTFSFANATWCLRMYPNGQRLYESEDYIDLMIARLDSLVPKHDVFYKLCFKTRRGKEFQSYSSRHVFETNDSEFGATDYLEQWEFEDKKDSIAPNGTVTVFCQMRTTENTAYSQYEAYSQNELIGSVQGDVWFSFPEELEKLKVGEISDQSFVFKDITWKIPDVFSLPTSVDYGVQSPAFSFANATWCLRMYPNGQRKFASNYVDLMIARLHSLVSSHDVFYKLGFTTRRGKECEGYSSADVFDTNNSEWGMKQFLRRSEFEAKKHSIAPGGTVTVACQMRTKENTAVEACSQTELVGSAESVNKLLQDFKELLVSEEGSDVTIQVKGQKFGAHSAILRARSPVFASMFKNDMKEKSTGLVDVEDCDPATFPDFLRFLYCGSAEKLSAENVFSLYTTSDKYDVRELKSECLQFMNNNLSVETFCDTITLSLKHSETQLTKRATGFFSNNLPEIIVTVKWQSFLADNPVQSNELLIKALASNKHSET